MRRDEIVLGCEAVGGMLVGLMVLVVAAGLVAVVWMWGHR